VSALFINLQIIRDGKMKRILVLLTILSFINFVGCYYQEQMNPARYSFDENINLTVTTKDTSYDFNGYDYYLNKDTLYGTAPIHINKTTKYIITEKIPVANIKKIETDRVNALNTTLIVVGTAAVLILAIGLITFDGPDLSGMRFGRL
jgi:hypothetical protein